MKNIFLIAALTLASLPAFADYKPTYEQCMEVEVEDKWFTSDDRHQCFKDYYEAEKQDDKKRDLCLDAAKAKAKKKAHEVCTQEDEKIEE